MRFTSKRAKSRIKSETALLGLMTYTLATSLSVWFGLYVSADTSDLRKTRLDTPVGRESRPATYERGRDVFDNVALPFEENRGQFADEVKFFCRAVGYRLFLRAGEATLAVEGLEKTETGKLEDSEESVGCGERIELRSSAFRFASSSSRAAKATRTAPSAPSPLVRPAPTQTQVNLKFVGANLAARLVAVDQLASKSHYLIGKDPRRWRTNIPNFARVQYKNLYRGIDCVFYGNGRQLEYDFLIAPGADSRTIILSFAGASSARIDERGDLLLQTPAGEIRQRHPIAYQHRGTEREEIACRFQLTDPGQANANRSRRPQESNSDNLAVTFELGDYDKRFPLVIDPVLIFSTYLGGSGYDSGNAIAVDPAGNSYIVGDTDSVNFPLVGQSNLPRPSSRNVFVTKLNPAGNSIIYSTVFGGEGGDTAFDVAVDDSGNAYVTGTTSAPDFPVTPNAFQKTLKDSDLFVSKLNPAGNDLVYSTYLGGTGTELEPAIAIDGEGNAYVTGTTYASDFPVRRALQSQPGTGCIGGGFPFIRSDAFISKLNPAGANLVYSTYLGGGCTEAGTDIAVDASGSVYVTGLTDSINFPVAGALYPSYRGGLTDAFLTRLAPSGRQMVFSTYLGGDGEDWANGLALDSAGNVYLTGKTSSPRFVTTAGALQSKFGGSNYFTSTDGGATWSKAVPEANGALPHRTINTLAIDPNAPNIVYAGLEAGFVNFSVVDPPVPAVFFRSTNAGATWSFSLSQENAPVNHIAVDPKNESAVYFATMVRVYKYRPSSFQLSSLFTTFQFVPYNVVAIDPTNANVLYVGVGGLVDDIVTAGNVIKSTDGGATWQDLRAQVGLGVVALAIDPKTTSTLYAGTGTGVSKSTDGGASWSRVLRTFNASTLAIDPVNPETVYVGGISFLQQGEAAQNVMKSTDGGASWSATGIPDAAAFPTARINVLTLDPSNPAVIYAGAGVGGAGGGVYKSTDSGASWSRTGLVGTAVKALAINPQNPTILHAGTYAESDAFVMKINAAGSAVIYSTFLGDIGNEEATGIAIDSAGNAFIAGQTFSYGLPLKDALQTEKAGNSFSADAFTTKLNAAGTASLFSTYLGGTDSDRANAIATDIAGRVYITGRTESTNFLTHTARQGESAGGADAFVIKLGELPKINGVEIAGKRLLIRGEGFEVGAVILVNGEAQATKNDSDAPATNLIAKKSGKLIASGDTVTIRVRNLDGTLSNEFRYTRP